LVIGYKRRVAGGTAEQKTCNQKQTVRFHSIS
jgi:hypothetical protein